MDSPTARLVVRRGPTSQPEYRLGTQQITIGRESGNEIAVNDPEVSRRHARITFQDGRYLIEDLNSTNGTFINDRRISMATPLNNNDSIDISDSLTLVYYGPGNDAGATIIEQPLDQIETPAVGRYEQSVQPPPAVAQNAPPPMAQPQVPPAWQPSPGYGPPQVAPQTSGRSPRRIIAGCGCLVLLAVFACTASLFLLDAYAPDLIYCGPLQPLFELLGFTLSCA